MQTEEFAAQTFSLREMFILNGNTFMDNHSGKGCNRPQYKRLVKITKPDKLFCIKSIGQRLRQTESITAVKARVTRFGRPSRPLPKNYPYQRWKVEVITGTAAVKECWIPLSTFRYRVETLIIPDEVLKIGNLYGTLFISQSKENLQERTHF